MRAVRAKKVRTDVIRSLSGPFDDSLIQILLDKIQKCLHETNKENFTKAEQFLRQTKNDLPMISANNHEKNIVKTLALNIQAWFYQKKQQYQRALQCLQQAEKIQTHVNANCVDLARTKLNKSVVFARMDKQQQAVQHAKASLNLLKNHNQIKQYRMKKHDMKLYEIMVVLFYNIASELITINGFSQTKLLHKQGYYLAHKILGNNHRLTLLLKSMSKADRKHKIKTSQDLAGSTNKSLIEISSSHHTSVNDLVISSGKEKELRRIYAPKYQSEHKDKIQLNKKQTQSKSKTYLRSKDYNKLDFYMKSLQKLKTMYGIDKKNKNRDSHKTEINQKQKGLNISNLKKIYTQTNSQQQQKLQHRKIKQIILAQRTKKRRVYTDLNNIMQPYNKNTNKSGQKAGSQQLGAVQHTLPIFSQQQVLKSADRVVENKADKEACQLI